MPNKKIALKNGLIQEVDDKDVQYEFENPSQFFGNNINLLPMQNAVASARAFYSEKFTNQTSALKDGEAPFVQSLQDPANNVSFQDILGKKTGVIEADDDIDILDVKPDYIEYKDSKGEKHKKDLYNNFAFNRKSSLKNIPLVNKGDKVTKGSILAKTNYTDNNGTLAIGRNALTGLVPYKGWTLDDAIVISEDFAKKLTSEQTYQYNEDDSDSVKTGKVHYTSLFPQTFKKDQLENIDENGVVKPGTVLKPGDPIILSTKPRMVSSQDSSLGKLSKYLKNTKSDASVTWDHEDDAVVTDVVKGKNGWKVIVDSYSPAKPGDKLTQREGNKGTISKIIPTELMPKTKDGRPLEVLLNPLSIPSRVNAAILYEMLLGKVAEKTGKPYKLSSFNGNKNKWYDFVKSELDKNGLTDTEEVFDPESGQYLEKPITVGNLYIQKLHHTGESKLSARGQGIYDSQQQPARGGDEGQNCFTAKTQINTLYGPIHIATICEKKLRIPVLTYDFSKQEWCYKPITDWFVRKADLNEIISVKFCTNAFRNSMESSYRIFNEASINVTKNHMVYDKDGHKIAIGSLHAGDNLYTYGPVPTKDQMALIYGTMLGDGYAHRSQNTINIQHGFCQYNYISWKQSILSSLNAKISSIYHAKQISKNSASSKPVNAASVSITYPWLAEKIRNECYSSSGRKTVTKEWLDKLNELSVVTLFMDDGSLLTCSNSKNKYSMCLCLHSFSLQENQMISDRIYDLTGIRFRPTTIKDTYKGNMKSYIQLRCTTKDEVIKMINLILKYIPLENIVKAKRYMIDYAIKYSGIKLPNETIKLDINSKIALIPVKIKSITPYKHDKPNVNSINVYDFTVESTHAYLAGNVLVSNSKRVGALENYSLMSAGAYNVIKDALSLRGQRNDEYWRAVREGRTPELAKKSPFVWDKLLAMLQGAGINAIDKGNGKLRAAPFTDKALDNYNPTELQNADIVDMKNLQPVKGGLFDPATSITNKWSKITLSEPIINPPFENMVASLLGVKKNDLYEIIQGKKDLDKFGTGSTAIKNALASIDPRKMFNESAKQFKEGPKTHKQKALNRMNYIKGMTRAGITPEDLVITKIPVIPPAFRPYSAMGDTFIPGDVNELYREVFNVNKAHKELKDELGEDEAKEDAFNLYKSVKALYGTDEPENKKLKQRGVSGFMQKLVGGTSKFSYLQKAVTAKPVDFSGRSVIGVNPELSMDEIGVPYDIAWKIFSPYVQRELSKKGLPLTESVKAIEERSDIAKRALEQVVKERPVLYSRAPSWHKFNTLGGWAKLHDGKNLLINPLTTTGLNADFDGDYQIGYIYVAIPK